MPERPDVTVCCEALEIRLRGELLRRIRIRGPFVLRAAVPPKGSEGRRRCATVHGSMQSELLVFLGAWLRAPHRVAAVAPSGRALGRSMSLLVPPGDGPVIELGAGTGSITTALLERATGPDQLVVVERDPELCRLLRRRFPDVKVLCADARSIASRLDGEGVRRPVRAVVSSLPLRSMRASAQGQVLEGAMLATGGEGPLIQFTYSLSSPIGAALLREHGVCAHRRSMVWQNLPPASVWTFRARRPGASPASGSGEAPHH